MDFERRFNRVLRNAPLQPGQLVLVRNQQIEKSLNKKHKPRYFGPLKIQHQTAGRSYILAKLDDSYSRYTYVASQLLPYIAHQGSTICRLSTVRMEDSDKEGSNEINSNTGKEDESSSNSTYD